MRKQKEGDMPLSKGLGTCLVMTACVLVGREASASVIFHNTGTLSGFSSHNAEHNGSIAEVTNLTYSGTTAIKALQVFDSSYTGRYHSEVVANNIYKRGDTGFYGFTFRLQADWQFQNQS